MVEYTIIKPVDVVGGKSNRISSGKNAGIEQSIAVEINAGKNGGIDTEITLFSEAGVSKPNQVLRTFPPRRKLR